MRIVVWRNLILSLSVKWFNNRSAWFSRSICQITVWRYILISPSIYFSRTMNLRSIHRLRTFGKSSTQWLTCITWKVKISFLLIIWWILIGLNLRKLFLFFVLDFSSLILIFLVLKSTLNALTTVRPYLSGWRSMTIDILTYDARWITLKIIIMSSIYITFRTYWIMERNWKSLLWKVFRLLFTLMEKALLHIIFSIWVTGYV